MRRASHDGLRLLPGRGLGARRRASDWLVPGLVAAVILAVVLASASGLSPERRRLRALPPEQRVAMVARTVDELRQFCGEQRADALKDHCHDLAAFASQFEECTGDCESLVRRELTPVPTR